MRDEQIEPAIVVEVSPGCGLGGMEGHELSLFGDVFEGDLTVFDAVVAEQRHGVFALLAPPSAAQHENVRTAIVVVIRSTRLRPPVSPIRPAWAVMSVKVSRPSLTPLLWKRCIWSSGPEEETTMSSRPSPSKSSMMAPPAWLVRSRPALVTRSTNSRMS